MSTRYVWKRYDISANGSQGNEIGYISSEYKLKYPENGIDYLQDGWFVYQGHDNIDADMVSYSPSNGFKAGDSITIIVNPSSSIKYSGTINYQYMYSTDHNSIAAGRKKWTEIGNPTSDTSKTFTIPENASFFQIYVQASDTYGFVSNSWTTGPDMDIRPEASITPKSVSYFTATETSVKITPSNIPKAGEEIRVVVETDTTFNERTLYYTYQYRVADEDEYGSLSWFNAGKVAGGNLSTGAAANNGLSKTITIDEDAVLFQARVKAGDNRDLISDWVYGDTLKIGGSTVETPEPDTPSPDIPDTPEITGGLKAYIGVGNKAKEIVRGYIGVTEHAKQWA